MKIAYLILVHHQPSHLARLIKALSCENAYFFVHVDLKANIFPFREAVPASPNIIFLETPARVKVYWGGYSMVTATLTLLRTAMDSGVPFTRYCLLSGSDFPVKKKSQIEAAFCTETEFLRVDRKLDYETNDPHLETVKHFHLHDNRFYNSKTVFSKRLFSITNRMLNKFPRKPYHRLSLYHGAAWWALTDQCIRYIFKFLEENDDYAVFFKYSNTPDEIFFHSIIKNSPFARYIFQDYEKSNWPDKYAKPNEHGCHYIDWKSKGFTTSPKLLDVSDMEILTKSPALFARKFDENRSSALLSQLEEMIYSER